jgi:hypothetical protein
MLTLFAPRGHNFSVVTHGGNGCLGGSGTHLRVSPLIASAAARNNLLSASLTRGATSRNQSRNTVASSRFSVALQRPLTLCFCLSHVGLLRGVDRVGSVDKQPAVSRVRQ